MSVASTAPSEPRLALRLGAFYFASFATLGLNSPYFPLWLEAHGFRGAPMGMIAALSPAMSFFGPPLVGLLSDARVAFGAWSLPAATRWLPGALASTLAVAFGISLSSPRTTLAARPPAGSALGSARGLLEQPSFRAFLLGSALSAASHSSYDLCG